MNKSVRIQSTLLLVTVLAVLLAPSSAQEIGGIELLDKLRSFDKSFLQSQTVVVEMQSQTKLEHMPDPESTKKRITLTSENGSIAIEREILYTSQPSYRKMTDQTIVDYDRHKNLLVWRTTRSRSLLEPDFQAHQKDLILIRVSPEGDLIEQEGAPTAELYKPTDSQRFMDFMFSIWTTGRGFADSLNRITEVSQEENGLIGIRAKGTFSSKMEGSWQMSLDPKAAYLVRSASFTSNGKDSPMFVCTTTGTKWSENCCLAEKANIGWGFDLLRGDLTTTKLEKFKLEADRPLFVKLRRILREKLALNTQVIDFRISPPYRFQVGKLPMTNRELLDVVADAIPAIPDANQSEPEQVIISSDANTEQIGPGQADVNDSSTPASSPAPVKRTPSYVIFLLAAVVLAAVAIGAIYAAKTNKK